MALTRARAETRVATEYFILTVLARYDDDVTNRKGRIGAKWELWMNF